MSSQSDKPLKIGYIWQYQGVGMDSVSASVLHIKAVRQGFLKRGHQVRLITVQAGKIQWSDDLETWHTANFDDHRDKLYHLVERGIRGIQSRLHLPYFRFFESATFAHACMQALTGCDVLYERHWLMAYGGLMTARRLNIPLLYEVNGDLVEEYALLGIKLSKAQWAVTNWLTRLMFRKAGRVITVSEPLRERTIERWRLSSDQVIAVNNGAKVDLFANPGNSEAVWSRYQLNGDPVVMFVGSFKPWHGLDLLLSAFGEVAAARPKARLVLVGDGPTRSELETQAKMLKLEDKILFTGMLPHDEVASLLSGSQVAILNPRMSSASVSQSPLKLFEYMAAGKAIVAPAMPNIEKVLTSGKHGLLVPPNDQQSLTSAIIKLLDDPDLRFELGRHARQEALEKHSWDRAVAEIEAVMTTSIAEKQEAGRST